jgi:hypothetical protein
MSSLGSVLARLVLLAGGAAIGALLARLLDEAMIKQAEERSTRDKNRYAQGLPPIRPGRPRE